MSEESPLFGSRPIAAILTGGAAFGAWQGGALYRLEKRGLPFTAVFGASAGSLNGAAYFLDELELLRERWKTIHRSDFMLPALKVSPPSLLSGDRLIRYLSGYVKNEADAKRAGRCHFFVITADLESGAMHQARYSPQGKDGWDGPLLEHLVGSCSIPGLFPPVRIPANGGPQRLLVDGGLQCFTDVRPALALGIRDFLLISVAEKAHLRPKRMGLKRFFAVVAEQLVQAQVDNTLETLRPRAELLAEKGELLRAYTLTPSRHLELDALGFSRKGCSEAFDVGEQDAAAFLAAPETFRSL